MFCLFSQDVTVAVSTETSIKTEDEVKEVLHDEEHRKILNAENVTEAKQMLLVYQVGIVRFILLTRNGIKVMNLCIRLFVKHLWKSFILLVSIYFQQNLKSQYANEMDVQEKHLEVTLLIKQTHIYQLVFTKLFISSDMCKKLYTMVRSMLPFIHKYYSHLTLTFWCIWQVLLYKATHYTKLLMQSSNHWATGTMFVDKWWPDQSSQKF